MPSSGYDKAEDHPRLRGEHMEVLYPIRHILGSPPPTRGTPHTLLTFFYCSWITPAYAGNTSGLRFFAPTAQDRPRLRGEHTVGWSFSDLAVGSPPPTRGTPYAQVPLPVRCGITPAYAGNTHTIDNIVVLGRDHPRLRGEHLKRQKTPYKLVGSPPPTRGTLIQRIEKCLINGITPAYAGNTSLSSIVCVFIWDHPRLRGEHVCTIVYR